MKKIILDFRTCSTKEEIHAYLKEQFGFPDHYGENLDALYDCLTDLAEDIKICFEDQGRDACYIEAQKAVGRKEPGESRGAKEPEEPEESKGAKESEESRGAKEPETPRESRRVKEPEEPEESRGAKEPEEPEESRGAKEPEEPGGVKEPEEPGGVKEPEEPREPKEALELKEAKETAATERIQQYLKKVRWVIGDAAEENSHLYL